MPGSIVCGVDGSPQAAGAVVFARILSDWLGWRLVLVHVTNVPVVPGASGVPGAYDELHESALADADELLDRTIEVLGLPEDAERRVELDDPIDGLVTACEEEDADLVVVGSHGRGRITSALLGSVSAGVVGRAPCPVAIVPERASLSTRALDRVKRRSIRASTSALTVQRGG